MFGVCCFYWPFEFGYFIVNLVVFLPSLHWFVHRQHGHGLLGGLLVSPALPSLGHCGLGCGDSLLFGFLFRFRRVVCQRAQFLGQRGPDMLGLFELVEVVVAFFERQFRGLVVTESGQVEANRLGLMPRRRPLHIVHHFCGLVGLPVLHLLEATWLLEDLLSFEGVEVPVEVSVVVGHFL